MVDVSAAVNDAIITRLLKEMGVASMDSVELVLHFLAAKGGVDDVLELVGEDGLHLSRDLRAGSRIILVVSDELLDGCKCLTKGRGCSIAINLNLLGFTDEVGMGLDDLDVGVVDGCNADKL